MLDSHDPEATSEHQRYVDAGHLIEDPDPDESVEHELLKHLPTGIGADR